MTPRDAAWAGLVPWPEDLVQRYREAGIWGDANLAQWLQERLAGRATETALIGQGLHGELWSTLSRRQLLDQVRRLARGLQAIGLTSGDRVVMQLRNSNAFVVTLLALFELGVIPVLALPGHRRAEIEHFLKLTSGCAWFASDDEASSDLQQLGSELRTRVPSLQHVILDGPDPGPHRPLSSLLDKAAEMDEPKQACDLPGHHVDPGSIALLLCSGGTTGLPKLIPRTHRDYIYNVRASAAVCDLEPEDRYLVCLPAAHNFPLSSPGILGAIDSGAAVVVSPSPSPETAFDWIERSGATVTSLVPPLARVWLDYAAEVSPPSGGLRLLQVGGARLDPQTARRIPRELGCRLQQVYGMAEGLLNYTRKNDPETLVNNTQGRPLSAFDEVRVVDPNGADVPAGQRGELWTRGPYTLRGYYRDPEANARAFSEDGFYKTGDLVRQIRSGHLIVEGRTREVIRRGAETVPVETIEALLAKHRAIREAAIVGLPCTQLGQRVCAVIAPNEGPRLTLAELRQYLVAEGVARLMLPESLTFVNKLPVTAVGKISKKQLVAQIQQAQLHSPSEEKET